MQSAINIVIQQWMGVRDYRSQRCLSEVSAANVMERVYNSWSQM